MMIKFLSQLFLENSSDLTDDRAEKNIPRGAIAGRIARVASGDGRAIKRSQSASERADDRRRRA